jgi:SAM-dependent methyltransferase
MIRPLRDFEEFRDVVSTYRLPRILLTALELDLFTAIGTRAWTVRALARRVKVSERGLDILLRNLASGGMLLKRGVLYRNGRVAATALNTRHPAYRAAYLRLIRNHWDDWSRLTRSVRRGKPVPDDTPDNAAYRREFSWAMHHRSMEIAPRVARQVDLRRARTLLDLGGGPGTYALAFLAENPQLQAAVCDRAPALEVAKELAARVRHGRRLSYLPLDFMQRPVPGQWDVIWYSNVLHIYSPEENRELFRRLRRAMVPGGRLLIQDAFLWDREGLQPIEANLFAVTMLLFTKTGNTYSAHDTTRWLREAGFSRVRRLTLRAGTGDWDGDLLEATVPARRAETRGRRPRSVRRSARR